MTQAVAAKRKSLYRQLKNLTEEDLDRVSHYAAFLQYLEDLEDFRDAVRISEEVRSGRMETYSLEEVKARLGLES